MVRINQPQGLTPNLKKEQVNHLLNEMIEILKSETPQSDFWCGTSKIQHYNQLGKKCLEKYEELYSLKQFDIRIKKLLEYLKESLIRMNQEEGEYNKQIVLLTCQEVLKREIENKV